MYMSLDDRKKLQEVLENALCNSDSDNVLDCAIPVKDIYLLLLSLIYELNSKDAYRNSDCEEFSCFFHRIQ